MTLTITCALCGHTREQHLETHGNDYNTVRWYCLAFCPCSGKDSFQGKGVMTPTQIDNSPSA